MDIDATRPAESSFLFCVFCRTIMFADMRMLLFLLMLTVSGALAHGQPEWPLWRGDPGMRGVSPQPLRFPMKLAWKFTAQKPIKATAVSDGKRAYLGDGQGKFYALNLADGSVAWSFALKDKDPIEGSAALVDDGVIFGAGDGLVYALDREKGTMRWKFETQGEIKGAVNIYRPSAGLPATVLVGSYDNNLYALRSDTGAKLWSAPTSNYINGAAALAGKMALFGGCDGFLYMVNAETGKEEGKVEVKDPIANTVATDGKRAFLSHYGNAVLSVDLTTKMTQWSYSGMDFPYFSSPAVTDKFVLVGDRGKYLRCLKTADGEQAWSYRASGKVDSSPLVAGDAVIFGSDDGRVYAVSLADGKELWQYEIGPPVQTSPCPANDRVIMGADDGFIYCFQSDSK